MGCGMSTLDPEDASLKQCENGLCRVMPPPVDKRKDFENGDEGESLHRNSNTDKDVVMVMKPLGGEEAKDKEGSNGERLKEKSAVERNGIKVDARANEIGGKEKHSNSHYKYSTKNNVEDDLEYDDDNFIVGPGSPSFREYCNDYDCGDRISMEYSNDCDSVESIKNGSEVSLIRNNKPVNEGIVDSNKEPGKKERRGRGFRNAINKGKARGRKNLLNFACYNGRYESRAEGSSDKIVAKTA